MNSPPVAPGRRYIFRFNASDLMLNTLDLAVILEPLLNRTGAHGATLYGVDEETGVFRAIAARSVAAPEIPELGVVMSEEASAILRYGPQPFQTSRAGDERFANLPEVLQHGLNRVLVFALRSGENLLGVLTVGRTEADPFTEEQIGAAHPIARVAGAVLERDALQTALKERKIIERAKGLLQRRHRLSEEGAYLLLKNQSRQNRCPMTRLAAEIIREATRQERAPLLPLHRLHPGVSRLPDRFPPPDPAPGEIRQSRIHSEGR